MRILVSLLLFVLICFCCGCPPPGVDHLLRQSIAEATRDGVLHWEKDERRSDRENFVFVAYTKDGDCVEAIYSVSAKQRTGLSYYLASPNGGEMSRYRWWGAPTMSLPQGEMIDKVILPKVRGDEEQILDRFRRQVIPTEKQQAE